MSWFDQGNKISESDLIAYHLHELPPRREREVARALERSASLTALSASVEATLRAVKDTPKPIDQAAFTRTWSALQPQLKPYAIPLPARPHWQTPVFAKAALAGLTAVGIGVVAVRMYGPSFKIPAPAAPSPVESTTATSIAPADPDRLPSVPSTGTFHDRLSTSLPQSRLRQPGGPPTPILTPYPVPSAPETATSEPPRPHPDAPSAQLPPLPAQPETPAEQNRQTTAATGTAAGKIKHGRSLPPASDRTDVMLALGGTFIPQHSSLTGGTDSRTVQATAAIAAIGAIHQQFHPAVGYRVTLSYTRPDFQYTSATGTGSSTFQSAGNVNTRIFEAAGTYVVQGPHRGRFSTAVDAGYALMAFLPTQDPAARYVYRGAGVVGASLDYALGRHWAARATYRAQLFRSPDFRYLGYAVPVTASRVVSHEPSVGIVYRFGKTEQRSLKPWAP